jgi:23S rRNA pseudouridine1911/1915/1917 synthase
VCILTSNMEILYEDFHLIAVNKPAPLLTQGPPGVPSLEAMIKSYIKEKYAKPAGVYLGVPHRLDRPVSGVIVFARNTKAAQKLAEQFQNHTVEKVYWAAVEGTVEPAEGEWHDWLLKLPDEARTERVEPETAGAKPASLSYRVLRPIPGGTLLELRPRTGRSHQLRVQSATRGHPILGDELYGSAVPFGPTALEPRDRIIALHAFSLTIFHPIRREPMTAIAPLPESWRAIGVDSI